jgi:hypothetical protein
VSVICNLFSLHEQTFFHKCVDFYIVFHLIKFAVYHLIICICSQVINGIFLNFYLHYSAMRCCPVRGNPIRKIVNLQLAIGFFTCI